MTDQPALDRMRQALQEIEDLCYDQFEGPHTPEWVQEIIRCAQWGLGKAEV